MSDVATGFRVDDIADRFWEGFLERQPVYASFIGDRRYDDRLEDPGPEGRAKDEAALRETLDAAQAIDPAGLETEDRITLDMLRVVAETGLAQHAQRFHEFAAVDHIDGPQGMPGTLARFQTVDSPEAFGALQARLAAYSAYIDAHITNMRDGAASGRTAARRVVERAIEQTERTLTAPVEESPLLVAIQGLDEAQRESLKDQIGRDVTPAVEHYLEALRAYLPHAREQDGVWAMPGGEEVYRTAIRASLSFEADPQELHDYGLAQIEAIDEERLVIAKELGHEDVASLRRSLEEAPDNFVKEPADLVELARKQIERAAVLAPRYFGRLPKAVCEVRAVEAYMEQEAPGAFYYPPPADGSRNGIYYINTYKPESRPVHQVATTTYHEAVPGHHFQCSIETELEGLHPFRRFGSRLIGGAYTEGWGLYSERLADEMGLFDDPRERLGMLDMQAMRAARLVVDTGLHAFQWDRARAADYLEAVGLTRLMAEIETDRYIVWAAQALSYMTGQREITALRKELEERDGDRFDLSAFHDAVLAHGALTLATLRAELPGWVKPRS